MVNVNQVMIWWKDGLLKEQERWIYLSFLKKFPDLPFKPAILKHFCPKIIFFLKFRIFTENWFPQKTVYVNILVRKSSGKPPFQCFTVAFISTVGMVRLKVKIVFQGFSK